MDQSQQIFSPWRFESNKPFLDNDTQELLSRADASKFLTKYVENDIISDKICDFVSSKNI